jgi:hypothetical protein
MNRTELRGHFEEAQKRQSEFAYVFLLLFVPNINCSLRISSLLPDRKMFNLFNALDESFEPLAIIGMPLRGGNEPEIIKRFPQESWDQDELTRYIEEAILGEQRLMPGDDPGRRSRPLGKPRLGGA